ncbi:response regulator transcription factor [Paraburkholderia pallida]|uniref:Response regulator transcription factor n=1 Tax=Paraburkholderia pallida TaxID=2547399 RepID=A0A4V1B098_9BURK|nr:response regulator [Paraburkholderia pallida]QBR02023.1 response regulator transcription factor [Paraburkholderia pallida]
MNGASELHATNSSVPSDSIVYVVDDDELLRRSLGSLLRSEGLRVETFASPREFLAFERPEVPSCLVLDVRLRGESGLAFQEEAASVGLSIPILFMTGYGDVQMSVKAMKRGAMNFLTKPYLEEDMVDAVTEALRTDAKRLDAQRSLAGLRSAYALLTAREREVMAFVITGKMNKQIAADLNIHEITVKVHRAQVMRKMQARTLPDLVRQAEALGIKPHGT